MADVRPFRGLRYNSTLVGDLAQVVCPPYDIVSPQEQDALHRRSPYNVIRLELGKTLPGDDERENRYTRAAALLRQWRDKQVLLPERRPCFYLLEESFTHQGQGIRRRSLLARVRLEEFERGVVLPHELTSTAPKEDRLQLMLACEANISPLLAIYRDPSGRISQLMDEAALRPPDSALSLGGEQRHRLWALSEPEAVTEVHRLLADKPLYLADGHHRYETALSYRDMARQASASGHGDEAYNFVLMALTEITDPGLLLLPYHRVLGGMDAEAAASLRRRLGQLFFQESLLLNQASPQAIFEGVSDALSRRGPSEIALGVYGLGQEGPSVLRLRDRRLLDVLGPSPTASALRQCESWVLHEGVLRPGEMEGADTRLDFVHDGPEAVQRVMEGRGQVAFLLRPLSLALFEAVVKEGERLPPKSTYFYPKLLTGMVVNPLWD